MKARDLFAAGFGRSKALFAIAAALATATLVLGVSLAAAAPPALTIDAPSGVETTKAHVSGEVTVPAEGPEVWWGFEYAVQGSGQWSGFPFSGTVPAGESQAVQADLTGLKAGTTYEVRLFADDFSGTQAESPVESFTTDPATVEPALVLDPAAASYLSAQLQGTIDPEGGNQEAGGSYVPIHWALQISQTGEPDSFSDVAAGDLTEDGEQAKADDPIAVSAEPGGLSPGTTYHYRLLVTYAGQTVEPVPGGEFTTLPVAKPTISNLAVSDVAGEGAHLSAEIDPGGSASAFDTAWEFQCVPACQGLQGGTVSGSAQTVENDATGLDTNTSYTVSLTATNAGGSVKDFTTFNTGTAAPEVISFDAGPVLPTSAELNAEIRPRGSDTVYWFEWGGEDCSQPGADCAAVPAEKDASAGSGQFFRYVSRKIAGLAPETTYHFRVVAESDAGTTAGEDREFTTPAPEPPCANAGMPGTGFLPSCRAYEMVSPPDKNGADVIASSFKTFAATDGSDAVAFPATGAFAGPRGTETDSQYLSRRTGAAGTNGWTTKAISPPTGSLPLLHIPFSGPTFDAAFTPDLTAAVYRTPSPLTDSPNVAGVRNLYRITDLESGSPQVDLLTASAAPLGSPPGPFGQLLKLQLGNTFAAASEDLGNVIFQSPYDLTGDGSWLGGQGESSDLYEYADGAGVRRVGRVPSDPGIAVCDDVVGPPCVDAVAQAGIKADVRQTNSLYSGSMISDDGSRILISAGGGLYIREDGVRTVKIDASEKTEPESPGAAEAWDMTPDGNRVFFITREGLVDGDDGDEGSEDDAYMYDFEAPAGERLTRLSDTGSRHCYARKIFGASEDGHSVYFTCRDQLVPGAPEAEAGLYLWHDGSVSYIGKFDEQNFPLDEIYNTPLLEWQVLLAKGSRISSGGRSLLFIANDGHGFVGRGGFSGFEHTGHRALYLYNADTGRLVCASCDPHGTSASYEAYTDFKSQVSAVQNTQHLSHALSRDGRYVFFSTSGALVPEDTNGETYDAYQYDSLTGEVRLLSSGTDEADSVFMDASPDGRDAYFATRERLVGWDTDTSYDLYDARVGGGFPEPVPEPDSCQGDSCLTAPASAPPPAAATSETLGEGNPTRTCPKGKRPVRKNGRIRCVKKGKRHAKGHQKRHANNDRRVAR